MYHLIALSGEHRGRRLAVHGAVVTIGSADGCEVRLTGSGIAARHAQLREINGVVTVSAIEAGAPVRVNGRNEIAHRLRPGDRLTIGEFEFEFQPPAGIAGAAPGRAHRRPSPWIAYSLIVLFVLLQIATLFYLNHLHRMTAVQPAETDPLMAPDDDLASVEEPSPPSSDVAP